MTLAHEKSELRKQALATRRDAHGKAGKDAGEVLADRFLAAKEINLPEPGAVLAGYWPVGSEIDTRPLMGRLHGAGYALVLPVVEGEGEPLSFRRWRPGDALVPGGHGTHAPKPEAEKMSPGVVLVPLLAFDGGGGRLGRGGGYYDRSLEVLRREGDVVALGVAYAAQRVAAIPQDRFDQKLDWIVTEDGVIQARVPPLNGKS